LTGELEMGFWEGEKCEYCRGAITEKTVDVPRKVGAKYVLMRNVPVGVCKTCGTRYYAANVLKTMQAKIKRRKPDGKVPMSVYLL
jgi:YgiT-type zinc finger domain-containing protein